MKCQYIHICKLWFRRFSIGKLSMTFHVQFTLIVLILSFQTKAQEITDSLALFNDTAYVSTETDEYFNRPGKFLQEPVFRSVPDTTVTRLKKEKAFAYANDPAYWVKEKKVYQKGFFDHVFDFLQSDAMRWIFWSLIGALVVFVIYRIIVVNDLFIFYSAGKKRKRGEDSANSPSDPLVIDQQINEAVERKHYNIAVRFLYIKTLHALNDKKWIQYHTQATNNEYLKQMSQHKLNNEFRFLTRAYEYVWYGKFDITEQQFALVHQSFKNFYSAI